MRLSRLTASRPWHLGVLVYLVLVLTSSLLAAPCVAGMDFGHWHQDDEPAHIHEMTGILTGAVTGVLVGVTVSFVPVLAVVRKHRQSYPNEVLSLACAIRAPPVTG